MEAIPIVYEKGKGDAERIPASPIYLSQKGLRMRVARPTDETQVLVRTVRFDVHSAFGSFKFFKTAA